MSYNLVPDLSEGQIRKILSEAPSDVVADLSPKERTEYAQNIAYFKERARIKDERLFDLYQRKDFREFTENLEELKREAKQYFENEINRFIVRTSTELGVDRERAYELLLGDELERYQLSLKEFLELAKSGEISISERQLLALNSYRARATRLEALQAQLEIYSLNVFSDITKDFKTLCFNLAAERYERSAFDLFKFYGLGTSLTRFNESRLTLALSNPWAGDGRNMFDRLELNTEKVRHYIKKDLTRQIITGESYNTIITSLAKKLDASIEYAATLVTTEAAFVATCSDQMAYEDLGVKRFQFVATLDTVTSEICRSMDLNVFKMEELKPGENAPPLHANCRSTIIPFTVGWSNLPGYIPRSRAARGKDGKTYLISGDTSYREWQKEHGIERK